ncbi:hypothetical protein ACU4HD_31135 [Cupriavidus basilensis]
MVSETFELAFHDSVLPVAHHVVARQYPGEPCHREATDQHRGKHGQQHELLLALVEFGEIAKCRDEVDAVPQSIEGFSRDRGI